MSSRKERVGLLDVDFHCGLSFNEGIQGAARFCEPIHDLRRTDSYASRWLAHPVGR
jgi:hypothetical protein